MTWQKEEASISVSGQTNASYLFEGAASTSVPKYTNARPPFSTFPYKYPHFWKNISIKFYEEKIEKKEWKKRVK